MNRESWASWFEDSLGKVSTHTVDGKTKGEKTNRNRSVLSKECLVEVMHSYQEFRISISNQPSGNGCMPRKCRKQSSREEY